METKRNMYPMTIQFPDKKHIVDTEDSIVESLNIINESQTNSKPITNDDTLT